MTGQDIDVSGVWVYVFFICSIPCFWYSLTMPFKLGFPHRSRSFHFENIKLESIWRSTGRLLDASYHCALPLWGRSCISSLSGTDRPQPNIITMASTIACKRYWCIGRLRTTSKNFNTQGGQPFEINCKMDSSTSMKWLQCIGRHSHCAPVCFVSLAEDVPY